MMMNENVVKILKAYMWDVATCSDDGNPNVVPVAFKNVTEDGKLVVGDVFIGPVVDMFEGLVEKTFRGAATAKGALVITPEQVIVTTPGADNKKVL